MVGRTRRRCGKQCRSTYAAVEDPHTAGCNKRACYRPPTTFGPNALLPSQDRRAAGLQEAALKAAECLSGVPSSAGWDASSRSLMLTCTALGARGECSSCCQRRRCWLISCGEPMWHNHGSGLPASSSAEAGASGAVPAASARTPWQHRPGCSSAALRDRCWWFQRLCEPPFAGCRCCPAAR